MEPTKDPQLSRLLREWQVEDAPQALDARCWVFSNRGGGFDRSPDTGNRVRLPKDHVDGGGCGTRLPDRGHSGHSSDPQAHFTCDPAALHRGF